MFSTLLATSTRSGSRVAGRRLHLSSFMRNSSKSAGNGGSSARHQATRLADVRRRNRSLALLTASVIVVGVGLSYAAVPLYRLFCQVTGYGGTVREGESVERLLERAEGRTRRRLTVHFNADVSSKLPWRFEPSQASVRCETGESVLAFYRCTNLTDRPLIGISTYNVTPMRAGQYFHKIQCFCFDEQRLQPHETVEMPVFFYVDPTIDDDKNCADVRDIVLSYTFFYVDAESGQAEQAFDDDPANQPV